MAVDTSDLAVVIYEEARQLPPQSLAMLAKFVEFLQYKAHSAKTEDHAPESNPLTSLEGLLAGYDVSPEALAGSPA